MSSNSIIQSLLFNIEASTVDLKSKLDEANGMFSSFGESAKKIGEVIGGIFAVEKIGEYAKAFFEATQRIGETKEAVESLQISGNIDRATASVLALSDTFGVDLNSTMKDINANSKAFGLSFDASSSIIEKGLALNKVNANEFLSIINNYSKQFAAAGISASAFAAITTQALQHGFGEDSFAGLTKGIKNLELMGPVAEKALTAVGLDTTKISQQLESGAKTPLDIIQEIGEKMEKLSPQSQEAAEAMALFGKNSTQMNSFVQMLANASTNMDSLVSKATEGQLTMLKLNQANKDWNTLMVEAFGNSSNLWSSLKAGFIEGMTTGLRAIIEGITSAVNAVIDWYNESLAFRILVQAMIADLKAVWETWKLIGEVILDVLTTAGRLIKDVFTLNWKDISNAFEDGFKALANDAVNYGKNVYDAFYDGVKTAVTAKPISHVMGLSGSGESNEVTPGLATQKQDQTIAPVAVKGIDVSKIATQVGAVKEQVNEAATVWDLFGEKMQKAVGTDAAGALDTLGDSLGKLISGQKVAFSSMVVDVLKSIEKIILGLEAEAIAASLASGIEEGGPVIGLGLAAVGIAAITAILAAHPFASGTDFAPGGLSLVGEKGPELMNIPRGSSVISNSNFAKGMSSSGRQQPIQVNVTGKIMGKDLYLSGTETNRFRNSTT